MTSNTLENIEPLAFDGRLFRRLSTRRAWAEIQSERFDLTVGGAGRSETVTLEPFLCEQDQSFLERIGTGWRVTETHEVFVTDSGAVALMTDFDHPLRYTCESVHPDGRDGDGIASVVASEPHCDDAQRVETAVELRGAIHDTQINARARTCWIHLTDVSHGRISMVMTAPTEIGELSFAATYCLPESGLALPVAISEFGMGCPAGASVSLDPAILLDDASGSWRLDSFEPFEGGTASGSLDVTARGTGGEVRVAGTFELPVVRVPLEGDWNQ